MPNDFDVPRWSLSLLAMCAMLLAFGITRASLDRWIPPTHPKRSFVDQAILYGSTFLLFLILWLLQR